MHIDLPCPFSSFQWFHYVLPSFISGFLINEYLLPPFLVDINKASIDVLNMTLKKCASICVMNS